MSLSQPEWEELVAEWRRSGESATRFAEEHGIAATALRYWINRPATRRARPRAALSKVTAAAQSPEAAERTPRLARVVRPGDPPPAERASELRVVIGKATIVVAPGFDEQELRSVVRALGELE